MTSNEVDRALAALNKKFGTGSVMRMGDNSPHYEIKTVSSGSMLLDLALGGKGFPTGRIIELI